MLLPSWSSRWCRRMTIPLTFEQETRPSQFPPQARLLYLFAIGAANTPAFALGGVTCRITISSASGAAGGRRNGSKPRRAHGCFTSIGECENAVQACDSIHQYERASRCPVHARLRPYSPQTQHRRLGANSAPVSEPRQRHFPTPCAKPGISTQPLTFLC